MIIDPELEIPAVLSQCPEEVQQSLGVAESFEGILEDCLSYLEWLKAQAGGFCEVSQFDDIVADNEDDQTDVQNEIIVTIQDLFEIKAREDESREDFAIRMFGDFTADEDFMDVVSGIIVPSTSVACPQDATDAHAAASQFVDDFNSALSYGQWLSEILAACCDDIADDYAAIQTIAEPKLAAVSAERDAFIEALWVFKGIDAIEGLTEAETLEEFTVRERLTYDNTDPLVVPVMSLETFIDVPELCDQDTIDAAQDLLELVGELNDVSAYVAWMKIELDTCSDLEELNIRMQIALINGQLATLGVEKQEQLDDLWSFTANEGETME